MWKTVVRRILIMIPQLFILSIIVFLIGKMMPGDPFTGLITNPKVDAHRIEELREKAGLNDPWPVQYKNWMKRVLLHGDFGMSYTYKLPVKDKIMLPARNTLWLSLLTVILTYLIGVPLGVFSGRYDGSKFDKGVMVYTFITYAIPIFILSLVFLLLFGYRLQIFPTSGFVSLEAMSGTKGHFIASRIYHMLLPAITAALLRTTGIVQYLRNEVIDAKSQDYVKTARSKGVPINKIYSRHIFRNSLLPIAAFFGFTVTGLLAGSVFIETIFMYQGMGLLFIESIFSRDYSVINALTLMYGSLALFGSLISDIIMIIVDPRIRIE
ncbi:MAG: ABC transporter permease [Treponema sp.]